MRGRETERYINLCSGSKIFEKIILQRIQEIQDEEKVDIISHLPSCTTLALIAIPRPTAPGLQTGGHGSARQEKRKLKITIKGNKNKTQN